jgi:hypothetical protein
MKPPFPECQPRPEYDASARACGVNQRGWFYGPDNARASIVAGDGLWGDGLTTWEVWYPGDDAPEPHQTAEQIARRMGRNEPAPPVWL